MAKILMLNIPMHGHVNPTIALTKELVERGHDVTYFINEEFRKKSLLQGQILSLMKQKPAKN